MSDLQQLYRHYDKDNNLLYVGVSFSAVYRLSQHKKISPWYQDISRVEIENFDSRDGVLDAERMAIITEKPIHNVRHNVSIDDTAARQSEEELFRNTVKFKPMYSIPEASKELGIGEGVLKRFINENKIGYVVIRKIKTSKGTSVIKRITGWQLIEFVEALENGGIDV